MTLVHVLSRRLKFLTRRLCSKFLSLCLLSSQILEKSVDGLDSIIRRMRSYRIAARTQTSALQIPTRFLAEIHIFLSCLVIAACIGVLVNLLLGLQPDDTHSTREHVIGSVIYFSLTIFTSLGDVGLAVLLIYAAERSSVDYSEIWFRSSLTLLVFFSLISIAFGVMLSAPLILLPLVPNLIFKPFALWLVNGYVDDLRDISSRHIAEQKRAGAGRAAGEEEISESEFDDWDGEGDRAGPSSRKRTTVFISKDDKRNANESSSELSVERLALIVKSAKSVPEVPGPSTRLTLLRHETISEE